MWRSAMLCSLMTAKMTRDRGLKTGHPVIQSCCQGREGETAAEYFQICGVTHRKKKREYFSPKPALFLHINITVTVMNVDPIIPF